MKILLFIYCLLLSNTAEAVRLALEPQNRMIVGTGQVDDGFGISMSVESRLTQLVYINLGGTISIPKHYGNLAEVDAKEWVKMNHIIWAAPGWRIHHRYSEKINWDVIARGGFACIFSTDAYKEELFLINPAGLAGVDGYINFKIDEKNTVGTRLTNKLFFYTPTVTATFETISVQKWQNGIEFFWQWQ